MDSRHSVEAYQDGEIVGGLYGVSIGGAFMGESMFPHRHRCSKVCLVYLVERMKERGFILLDSQYVTDHLSTFNACNFTAGIFGETQGCSQVEVPV